MFPINFGDWFKSQPTVTATFGDRVYWGELGTRIESLKQPHVSFAIDDAPPGNMSMDRSPRGFTFNVSIVVASRESRGDAWRKSQVVVDLLNSINDGIVLTGSNGDPNTIVQSVKFLGRSDLISDEQTERQMYNVAIRSQFYCPLAG